ncbi:MAG: hypothetical protein ACYC2Z_00250 [Candidatus Nanopelagicales bacterium]
MTASFAVRLADQDPDVLRKLIDDAGPIAFAFVIALGVALFVLFRSMNKQMKRIDPNLPSEHDDEAPGRGPDEPGNG